MKNWGYRLRLNNNRIILLIIIFISTSCSSYTPCCDSYDFHFPNNPEYNKCYKFIIDVLCNPDKIYSFKSDFENCNEYARDKYSKEKYLSRHHYSLTEFFQCNTLYKEEVFLETGEYQPFPILIVRLRNIDEEKIEFHFKKKYGKWKFIIMHFGKAFWRIK